MKLALAILLAAASSSLAARAPQQPSRTLPVLIAKGDDYLIHGTSYPFLDDQTRFHARPWGGCAILYTRPSTGEMKALVSTGTVERPTERISFHQTRLLGVACDAERLYAVVWSSGRVFDHPPHPGQPTKGGSYSLHVFWLADGTSLGETWLLKEPGKSPVSRPNVVAAELPDSAPQETLEKGPLKLIDNGILCYGVALEYAGKTLSPEGPTPVAGALAEQVGQRTAYTGIARDGKPGAYVANREGKPEALFLEGRRQWEPATLGKQVTAKGVLRMRLIGSNNRNVQAPRQPIFYMAEHELEVGAAEAPKPK